MFIWAIVSYSILVSCFCVCACILKIVSLVLRNPAWLPGELWKKTVFCIHPFFWIRTAASFLRTYGLNQVMYEQMRASYFWSDKETKFCLSVMKELNIIGSLDKRKPQNADLCKSIVKGLQDTGHHVCNGVLAFNGAKPVVNHSGVIFLWFKMTEVCAVKIITGSCTSKMQLSEVKRLIFVVYPGIWTSRFLCVHNTTPWIWTKLR